MPPAGNWGRCGCPDAHPEPAQLLPRTFWRTQQRKSSSERDLPAEGNAGMGFPPRAAQGAEAAPAREEVTDAAVPKCLSPGRRGQPSPPLCPEVTPGAATLCHGLWDGVSQTRLGLVLSVGTAPTDPGWVFCLVLGLARPGSWMDSMILGVCS